MVITLPLTDCCKQKTEADGGVGCVFVCGLACCVAVHASQNEFSSDRRCEKRYLIWCFMTCDVISLEFKGNSIDLCL